MVVTFSPNSGSAIQDARPYNEFLFEPRGEIAVKGKGNMRTWFLLAQQASASAN